MLSKVFNLVVLPLFFLLLLTVNVSAQGPSQGLSNRVLVKFAASVDRKAVIEKYQARLVAEIPKIDVTVLESRDQTNQLIENLRRERIDYVEIDGVATALTNDSLYSSQWALPKISWDRLDATASAYNRLDYSLPKEVYNPATSSSKIAVVDTGVDYTHPDLSGKVETSEDWDFVNNDNDAMDDNLHGTHVAGIAAAATNNNAGVAGVSINTSTILPVKVLDEGGYGYYSWISSGIIYAVDHGARVINLSLGGSLRSATLENAVSYAWSKGAVVVAAAGNSSNPSKTYPAAYPNAIAVWASNQNDYKASFSSYGTWVDIGAPGVSILSTVPANKDTKDGKADGYYLGSGTSMATPHVAGLAGLLLSQHPDWSALQVRNRIESTADLVPDRLFRKGYLGKGRINVFKALAQ